MEEKVELEMILRLFVERFKIYISIYFFKILFLYIPTDIFFQFFF